MIPIKYIPPHAEAETSNPTAVTCDTQGKDS